MGYSAGRKAAVLARMVPPSDILLQQLSQEEGISAWTLSRWRTEAPAKGALLPGPASASNGWSARDKFAAVVETAAMNEAELAEYCRRRGLYVEQLSGWRNACEQANDR